MKGLEQMRRASLHLARAVVVPVLLLLGSEAQAQTNCGVNGCEAQLGETCVTCPQDCGCIPPQLCNNDLQVCEDPPVCDGDGTCEAGENPQNCPNDCFCGDTFCSAPFETCVSCPFDCPVTPGCEASVCCAPGEVVHPDLGICIHPGCLDCPEGSLCDLDTGECLSSPPPGGGGGFQTQGFEFFHLDALGSVRLVTNEAANVVSRHDYLPFGEELPADMGSRDGIPGYGASPSAPIRFTGKDRDTETGLDYFGARYFSGAQGRFTSADPGGAGSHVGDPQSWNAYAYALNNPLKYVDPDGESPKIFTTLIKVAVKGGDLYSSVSGIIDATGTIFSTDPSVGTGARILATGSLISEISGATDIVKGVRAVERIDDAGDALKAADRATDANRVATPYKRPSGATTPEQRAAVQGQPCVDCGDLTPKQYADHKKPLVKEHYETGTIEKKRMRETDAVQPQCPTCSNRQGAELSRYSREQKKKLREKDEQER